MRRRRRYGPSHYDPPRRYESFSLAVPPAVIQYMLTSGDSAKLVFGNGQSWAVWNSRVWPEPLPPEIKASIARKRLGPRPAQPFATGRPEPIAYPYGVWKD